MFSTINSIFIALRLKPLSVLSYSLSVFIALMSPHSLAGQVTPSPAGAKAYIITPEDGARVKNPVTVRFGLQGMGVAPAGIKKPNTGHHHLLIDAKQLPAMDKPMGAEVTHFGAGQTEVVLELSPGEHTLQLILGDHFHMPHDPPVLSEKITFTVE